MRRLATAAGLALVVLAGSASAHMGGHGFRERRFHADPFGFGYYAPYAGDYPYPPTAYERYCNQLSPYYDPYVCWDYYCG